MPRPSIRPLALLARHRLARTTGARAGTILGALTAVTFAAIAVVMRQGDGKRAAFAGLVPAAARFCLWLAGAPVALAAAHARGDVDRADGIEDLAAMRGVSDRELESARALAAMFVVTRAVGLPVIALALVCGALAATSGAVVRLATSALGAAAFAAIVGVTLGGIAAACSRLGRNHGRGLLVAIVVVPWLLADLVGRGAYSIPGAFEAVLSYTLGAHGAR